MNLIKLVNLIKLGKLVKLKKLDKEDIFTDFIIFQEHFFLFHQEGLKS